MLASLLNVPKSQQDWDYWSYNHRTSYQQICQAISNQKSVLLTDYQVDPIASNDVPGFLERNSQLHIDMNTVLGLITTDLEDADFSKKEELESWIFLHYQEHFNAEQSLGIGS